MSIASPNRFPSSPTTLARKISDRHFGVGSDGLILICPSRQADARMRMFNADGSESEMCGNGIRCVAKYVYDHGICRKETLRIETGRGVLALKLEVAGGRVQRVRVDMGEPILQPARIPTTLPGSPVVDAELDRFGRPRQMLSRHLRFDGQPALHHVRRRAQRRLGAGRRAAGRDRSAFSPPRERRIRPGAVAHGGPHAGLGAGFRRNPGLRHRGLRRLRGRRA